MIPVVMRLKNFGGPAGTIFLKQLTSTATRQPMASVRGTIRYTHVRAKGMIGFSNKIKTGEMSTVAHNTIRNLLLPFLTRSNRMPAGIRKTSQTRETLFVPVRNLRVDDR